MDIKEALKIIKSAMPLKADSENTRILHEMCDIVKKRTSDFKKPEGISSEKIDLKPLLIKEKISPAKWKNLKGSFRRSEEESVIWLAEILKAHPGKDDADLKLRIRIAEAEAQAIQIQLELLRLKNK